MMAAARTPSVSVVIVSFNTLDKLKKCLSCLDLKRYQVIVIDNASSDGSAEWLGAQEDIEVVLSETNLGFGRANNIGFDRATGDLVLYLNSDAYAHESAVDNLARVFEDEDVAAAGGKLLNPNGSLQQSAANYLRVHNVVCEQLFLEPIAQSWGHWDYWITKWTYPDVPTPVPQVMGACLMVRRRLNEKFDEDFFLYCEDTELCLRLIRHGRILYVPTSVFTHELGSSSVDSRWKSVCRYNAGKELYFTKYFGAGTAAYVRFLHKVGAVLRLIYGVLGYPFLGSAREKYHTFKKVLTAKTEDFIPAEHRRRPQP